MESLQPKINTNITGNVSNQRKRANVMHLASVGLLASFLQPESAAATHAMAADDFCASATVDDGASSRSLRKITSVVPIPGKESGGAPPPPVNILDFDEFCHKYSIPLESRPKVLVREGLDIVQMTVPSTVEIEHVFSVLSNVPSVDESEMQRREITSRWTRQGKAVQFTVIPTLKNVKEGVPTKIVALSDEHNTAIEMRKKSGTANKDDANFVKLLLYFSHVRKPPGAAARPNDPLSELRRTFMRAFQGGPTMITSLSDFGSPRQSFAPDGGDLGEGNEVHAGGQPQTENEIKQKLEKMGLKVYLPSDAKEGLDWEELAGYDDAKRSIEETLLTGLKYPELFEQVTKQTRGKDGESNRPRMILFNGPPGTGKTSTARIIASQVKLPLIYVSLESIVSKWFGDSERNLGQIFDCAKELGQLHNGCVIFVDEVDSLAASRDDQFTTHEASRRILSTLLRRLDGFDTQKDKTIMICATNREHDLDSAFRSRVDVTVQFPLPTQDVRKRIFKRYARHLGDAELDAVALATEGLSGRNIKDVCQVAERRWVSQLVKEKEAKEKEVKEKETKKGTPESVSPPPSELYIDAAKQKVGQQK